jgi:hypothetical protein
VHVRRFNVAYRHVQQLKLNEGKRIRYCIPTRHAMTAYLRRRCVVTSNCGRFTPAIIRTHCTRTSVVPGAGVDAVEKIPDSAGN